jgi:hypothetical protein
MKAPLQSYLPLVRARTSTAPPPDYHIGRNEGEDIGKKEKR